VTRQVILDALIDQLAETGAFDYSVFEIARRAGVSVRTVYRHFPDRDSLLEALARQVNERVGLQHDITPEGLPGLARELFARFDQHPQLIRAQLASGGSAVRARARKERVALMRKAVDAVAPELPEHVRMVRAALMSCLFSADVWSRMRDEFGIDGAETGEAVAWALATLRDALADESRKTRRKGKE
jgi:AcrR family transcriptional regulator